MKSLLDWENILAAILLALGLAISAGQIHANPVAGPGLFSRPINGGIAISVQAILANDSDSAQVPIFVAQVDNTSASGGVIARTNDWLYYAPPTSLVATDSFNYVLSNLLGQSTSGTVTILASSNFVATNILKIAALPGGGNQLQFFGAAGSYFIQTSTNLTSWTNLAARLAWPTNYFIYADTNPPSAPAKFYRAATGALAPAITNYQASGTNHVQVDFTLGIEGGATSLYPATILSLPASGYLFRDDGSILSNAPAAGANGALHYFNSDGSYDSYFATFQYKLTRPTDGLDSLPATFTLSLAEDVPTLSTPIPNIPENGSNFIQLLATDSDLRYASNHLTYNIIFPTTLGTMYQVNQDGVPDFTQPITNQGVVTLVSNTNELIFYVPPKLQQGLPYESFTWQVANSFGITTSPQSLPINVYFVNSPPIAEPCTITGKIEDWAIQVYLPYSDPDNNLTNICISSPPTRGQLHYGGVSSLAAPSPANLVSATNNSFPTPGNGGTGFLFVIDSHTNGFPCVPDSQDYASPYATFTYVVTDAGGLSATNTAVIDVQPLAEPFPYPATPNFTGLINSTNIPIFFAAANLDGTPYQQTVDFRLTQLPTHGTLNVEADNMVFPILPADLPADLLITNLVYLPDPGYYSSRDGTDSFSYLTLNGSDSMACSTNVTLTVIDPPTLINSNNQSVIVTLDASQNIVSPGESTAVVVLPDDANTNSLLRITFSGPPPHGYFTLNSTNGLVNLQTNAPATLQFQGTPAALNAALANGVNYYSSTPSANSISVTLNDLGATGFGTNTASVNLPVFYRLSGPFVRPQHTP